MSNKFVITTDNFNFADFWMVWCHPWTYSIAAGTWHLRIATDESLLFKEHIEKVSNTLTIKFGIIRKLATFFPKDIICMLYFISIDSYILCSGSNQNCKSKNIVLLSKRYFFSFLTGLIEFI